MSEVVMALADIDEEGIVVSGEWITNFLFADDIASLINGQSELQHQINNIHLAAQDSDLRLAPAKRKCSASQEIHQL